MAVTFVQALQAWDNNDSPSDAFTPDAGDTILTWAVQGVTDSSFTFSGTGTYSAISALSIPNDNQGDCWAAAANSDASAESQTITVDASSGFLAAAWMLDYSGVASFSASYALVSTPGTGTGAILGNAVEVPEGSILVAACADVSAGSEAISSPSGTNRGSEVFGGSLPYCITEYTGTGASITPSFTSSEGDADDFVVIQFLLMASSESSIPFKFYANGAFYANSFVETGTGELLKMYANGQAAINSMVEGNPFHMYANGTFQSTQFIE